MVAEGEARARHVVTGRVVNCLMLGCTLLPAPPLSVFPSLPINSIAPSVHFTAGYYKLEISAFDIAFLLFAFPTFLRTKQSNQYKSAFGNLLESNAEERESQI